MVTAALSIAPAKGKQPATSFLCEAGGKLRQLFQQHRRAGGGSCAYQAAIAVQLPQEFISRGFSLPYSFALGS